MTQSLERVARDSAIVTLLNVAVQLVNFLVYAIIAALFGASWQSDAFFLAMALPTFFVGALVNAVSSVLIPVITECSVRRPHALGQLLGSVLVYLFIISTVAAAAVALVSPALLRLTATSLLPAGREVAMRHTLYLLPMVALQSTTAVFAAAFNSERRFRVPPATDFAGSLATLAWIVLLTPRLGNLVLPTAFLAGALVHLVLLAGCWPWRERPLTFGLGLAPDLARSFRLAVPMVLGVAAVQLSVAVSRYFAAGLATGSVSVLDYASRLSVGVMELLTSGVFLVTLADWSHIVTQDDMKLLRDRLRQTTRMVLFLVLPAVAILIALRHPVVALALMRGRFDVDHAALTSGVLLYFLLGIPADAVARIYARLFLVWQDTWTLCRMAVIRLAAMILLSLALVGPLAVPGLALADGLSVVVITVMMVALADRRLVSTLSGLTLPLAKIAFSAAAAGAAAAAVHGSLGGIAQAWPWPLFVAAAAGCGVYLGLAWLLRTEELRQLHRFALRRLASSP